jgi:CheY-like chemotaxis protein
VDAHTILVVENDNGNRDILRRLLELEGYHVIAVDNGQAALDLLAAVATPLIVLVDFLMVPPNGLDVMRAVAADPLLAQRHAMIMLSAAPHALPPDAQAIFAQLHAPLLSKPYIVRELLQAVADASARLAP